MKPFVRLVMSWDDVCHENERLVDLMIRYGIPSIFFLQANTQGLAQAASIARMGSPWITIGSHGMAHPHDIKRLNDDRLVDETLGSKFLLEQETGNGIQFFCYPRGRHDFRVREAVAAAGYTYARTTIVLRTIHEQALAATTSVHCFPRHEYKGESWWNVSRQKIDSMANVIIGYVHIWGHGWELRENDWQQLEGLLERINEKYAIADIRSELK